MLVKDSKIFTSTMNYYTDAYNFYCDEIHEITSDKLYNFVWMSDYYRTQHYLTQLRTSRDATDRIIALLYYPEASARDIYKKC